ncbi:hypothetical protein BJY21_000070 [Kineosphaera limosa]|uniref:MOSC domain-containing protein n=1 Tax=Kineosphaera limosa NBRC 100340 TaxID=1184609 RepID=K6W6J6_9MICO|nr:hypothetical protein [Kineosphaera limosa]NYD98885.1 hypothetical protein [Kineosphaera limosa]GAB94790.1 hypothetical protein KILIM_011_00630 [Kineosphaera limosa NBRC 100340]
MSEQAQGPVVVTVAIYPTKGEAGQTLDAADIEAQGLAGDRRKKRPVHLVGAGETPETTRANLFLDLTDDQLGALLEHTVRVGDAALFISERPTGCPGVYAVVAESGRVAVGDHLTILPGSPA